MSAFTVATQPPFVLPKVSVSMLTYNAAEFIATALDSVLIQEVTFPVEIVVGDDCSGDDTRAILEDYRARFPHVIRLNLLTEKGAGQPGRVNNVTTLGSCRGEYIAMLDGDDRWLGTEKLAAQAAFLDANSRYSSVVTDGYYTYAGERQRTRFEGVGYLIGADINLQIVRETGNGYMLPTSLMFRRTWLLPLPPWFSDVIVADFFMRLILLRQGPCRVLAMRAFEYRIHGAQVVATHARPEMMLPLYDDSERVTRYFPELVGSPAIARRQAKLLTGALRDDWRNKSPHYLGGVLARALGKHPIATAQYIWSRIIARATG